MVYEDFTTFTEFDEGGDVTVDSATKVSWVSLLSRSETAYLYKDKGIDHFDGDFTHKFELQFSNAGDNSWTAHWMLSNIIGDIYDASDQNKDTQSLFSYHFGTSVDIYLRIIENGGVGGTDIWSSSLTSTIYYVEVVRDDDGGAHSTGRLTAYIRTGSHSGVLQDTLVTDSSVGEQNDFRYIYPLATYDDAVRVGSVDGFTQNFDIGEAAAGWTGKMNGITNPAKINGIAVANIAKVIGQ